MADRCCNSIWQVKNHLGNKDDHLIGIQPIRASDMLLNQTSLIEISIDINLSLVLVTLDHCHILTYKRSSCLICCQVYLHDVILSLTNEIFFMKPSLFVSSVMSNINLPKTKLEGAANNYRKNNLNRLYGANFDLPGYESIVWQFIKTTGTGNVQMVLANKQNNNVICLAIPAMANFLAICTKGRSGNFGFEFGISLS